MEASASFASPASIRHLLWKSFAKYPWTSGVGQRTFQGEFAKCIGASGGRLCSELLNGSFVKYRGASGGLAASFSGDILLSVLGPVGGSLGANFSGEIVLSILGLGECLAANFLETN